MKENVQQYVADALSRPASAAGVSAATTATGVSAYFELISPIIGGLAALTGLALSLALIYKTHVGIKLDRLKLKELERAANR